MDMLKPLPVFMPRSLFSTFNKVVALNSHIPLGELVEKDPRRAYEILRAFIKEAMGHASYVNLTSEGREVAKARGEAVQAVSGVTEDFFDENYNPNIENFEVLIFVHRIAYPRPAFLRRVFPPKKVLAFKVGPSILSS